MNASSDKYGPCEVCKQYASEVFHQVEEKQFYSQVQQKIFFTQYGCYDLFGHKECLIAQQKENVVQ